MVTSSTSAEPRAAIARFFRFGVRRWLGVTLLTVFVPGFLVAVALQGLSVERQRAAALQTDLELSRSVAAAFDAYVEGIARAGLAVGLGVAALPDPRSPEATAYLTANAAASPAVRAFAWVDPAGTIVASGPPESIGLKVANRGYFRAVVEGREWTLGDLMPSPATGAASFVVARAIRGEGGALRGVVLASIDPTQLGRALDVSRAAGGVVGVVDRTGWTVWRFPGPELTWDERPSGGRWMDTVRDGRERTGFFELPWDSRRMAAGFAPIGDLGWVAVAARPEEAVIGPILRDAARDLAVLSLVWLAALVAALLVGRHVTRPIKALRAGVAALASDAPSTPVVVSGPREMRELAAAFNSMAEDLRRRDQEREEYLHAISHDLRAPLTAIQGQAQLLRLLGETANPRVAHAASAIEGAAHRMTAMIRDLVESARLAHGQVELQTEPADLGELARLAVESSTDPEQAARVAVDVEGPLPSVMADRERLGRVVANLVTNALKYGRPGTPVRVRVAAAGDEVAVTVADEGPGIAPDELPRLFQRYGRTSSSRGRRDSLGLGLFIVRSLVEAHGGRVWVESEPGVGSVFGFALPQLAEDQDATGAAIDTGRSSPSHAA